jgi:hypothetical protein
VAISLLLIFVVGLGLLPIVYLQRSRRRWQWVIRENGVPTEATVISIVEVRDSRRIPIGWSELTFEFQADDATIETRVWVRSPALRADRVEVGTRLNIHHMPHVPSEAVPDTLDCRPPWANVRS